MAIGPLSAFNLDYRVVAKYLKSGNFSLGLIRRTPLWVYAFQGLIALERLQGLAIAIDKPCTKT